MLFFCGWAEDTSVLVDWTSVLVDATDEEQARLMAKATTITGDGAGREPRFVRALEPGKFVAEVYVDQDEETGAGLLVLDAFDSTAALLEELEASTEEERRFRCLSDAVAPDGTIVRCDLVEGHDGSHMAAPEEEEGGLTWE